MENTRTARVRVRQENSIVLLGRSANYAERNTNSTAAMTTDTQKTPMPAMTTPWWDVVFTAGGTSGIRIFLDLARSVMSIPQSSFDAIP